MIWLVSWAFAAVVLCRLLSWNPAVWSCGQQPCCVGSAALPVCALDRCGGVGVWFFRALYGFLLSRFSSFTFWLWLPRTLNWLLKEVGPQICCLRCGCVVVAVAGGDLPAGTAPEKQGPPVPPKCRLPCSLSSAASSVCRSLLYICPELIVVIGRLLLGVEPSLACLPHPCERGFCPVSTLHKTLCLQCQWTHNT